MCSCDIVARIDWCCCFRNNRILKTHAMAVCLGIEVAVNVINVLVVELLKIYS